MKKEKKNRDEWGREELTSEKKKSHGEGVVARDTAERERERELVMVCWEGERARGVRAMRERTLVHSVWCAERGLQEILISLLFNENFKLSQISILKYFVKMTTF